MQDALAQWFGQTGVPSAKNGLSNNNKKKKNEIISLSAKWATTNFWIISKIVHIKIYRSYLFFIALTLVANEKTSFSMCGISRRPQSITLHGKWAENPERKEKIYIKKLVSSFHRINSETSMEEIKVVKELQLTN